jgi:hypothetical protein
MCVGCVDSAGGGGKKCEDEKEAEKNATPVSVSS